MNRPANAGWQVASLAYIGGLNSIQRAARTYEVEIQDMPKRGLDALSEPVVETENPEELVRELARLNAKLQRRVNIEPASVERDLAKLVLGLIEFIRRLLERQAIRRVEGGGLTAEQIENLGLALLKLESTMQGLKAQFGLSDEDINLDLGPIGRLL